MTIYMYVHTYGIFFICSHLILVYIRMFDFDSGVKIFITIQEKKKFNNVFYFFRYKI